VRAAIVTISTSKASGEGEDESGPALADFAQSLGAEIEGRDLIPDEGDLIEARLRHWADLGCDLVLTSGGTGFAPSDVTPEATRAAIEREAPGIAEAMRAASRDHTPHWMLSRAIAGIRGRTLIINFPGNPKAVRETAAAIAPALPHALALLTDRPTDHKRAGAAEAGVASERADV
jgi:molybdenum cofactor synthesis domain-containing protein